MYGTIGRLRINNGAEADLVAQLEEFSDARVPGATALYLYRMDGDPYCFYTVVVFESKEAYLEYNAGGQSVLKNAARLLQATAEWNDGEIVYESEIAYGGL